MSTLRPYQEKLTSEIEASWYEQGQQNVLAVMATGGGKTVCMSSLAARIKRQGRMIAHRQELVGQISCAMAFNGVPHRIIAPNGVIKFIVALHVKQYGRSFYHAGAPVAVAGVDTLLKRGDDDAHLVEEWHVDEGHHVVVGNKWHKVIERYPLARGALWTATPVRADRKRLMRSSGQGVADCMVQGPPMAWLIGQEYLTPYLVYGPPPSIDRSRLELSESTGDFKDRSLREQTRGSTIVGDVVGSYLKFAPGELGTTFCVDEQMATEQAAAFNQQGVPAAVLTWKTPAEERVATMEAFAREDIKQVCNVNIFGEGTDVPGLVVVSMARATESLGFYYQMFGRMMRTKPGKRYGILIDHVGNLKHGLPDGIVEWTANGEPRRPAGQRATPVRGCEKCWRSYEGYSLTCPYCGHRPPPIQAERPEQVEGDLTEYGPELLAQLRAKAAAAIREPGPRNNGYQNVAGMKKAENMLKRSQAQHALRDAMAWWAGVRRDYYGDDDSTSYRRFYHLFGIDVANAQGLDGPKARDLTQMIWKDLNDG